MWYAWPPRVLRAWIALGSLVVLMLTRRIGETVVIGRDIKIRVVAVRGKLVSLGVNAPNDVKVYREEISDRIALEEANHGAATAGDGDGDKPE